MNYEGQICRAPMERSSFMLPVMVGCSYNNCKFCNLFRHLKYRVLPLEQVEAELKRVYDIGGKPEKIFLGDGNAFGLPTDYLIVILDKIHHYFPECQCINMDATVTAVLKKSDEELKILYENGVRHLYIGIESGLDDVLRFMHKDHNLAQAYEAIDRLHRVGLIYDAHIMTGVAGKGRGVENAQAMADFLIRTRPRHVVNFSMFLSQEVPLYQDIVLGNFKPADELENLREEHELLTLLSRDFSEHEGEMQSCSSKEWEILYDGFHDYIEFRVRGILPRDHEKMLRKLEKAIEAYENTDRPPLYAMVRGECPHLEKCEDHSPVWNTF